MKPAPTQQTLPMIVNGYNNPVQGHNAHPMYQQSRRPRAIIYKCETYLTSALESGRLRHVDALAHVLGIGPPSPWFSKDCETYLDHNESTSARIMSLSTIWHKNQPRDLTEAGIADMSIIHARYASSISFSSLLDNMRVDHLRITDRTPEINGGHCESHPEDIQFGQTSLVTYVGVQDIIKSRFEASMSQYSSMTPIVIIGHDMGNFFEKIEDSLGIKLRHAPVLITLDTLVMAKELGIIDPRGPKISLRDLRGYLGITEDTNFHNAGNDAAYTMIVASLLVNNRNPGRELKVSQAQVMADVLKSRIRQRNPATAYGVPGCCMRCKSKWHTVRSCPVKIFCIHCIRIQPEKATTHASDDCPILQGPCKSCIAHPEEPKRYWKADTHGAESCPFNDSSEEARQETREEREEIRVRLLVPS